MILSGQPTAPDTTTARGAPADPAGSSLGESRADIALEYTSSSDSSARLVLTPERVVR